MLTQEQTDRVNRAFELVGIVAREPMFAGTDPLQLSRYADDALMQCVVAYDEKQHGPWMQFARGWLVNALRTRMETAVAVEPTRIIARPPDDLPTPAAVKERVKALKAAMLGSIRPQDVADVMERALHEAKSGKVDAMRFYLGVAQAQIESVPDDDPPPAVRQLQGSADPAAVPLEAPGQQDGDRRPDDQAE
jgi:hypothetical protein